VSHNAVRENGAVKLWRFREEKKNMPSSVEAYGAKNARSDAKTQKRKWKYCGLFVFFLFIAPGARRAGRLWRIMVTKSKQTCCCCCLAIISIVMSSFRSTRLQYKLDLLVMRLERYN
jgi:hypothetical protein